MTGTYDLLKSKVQVKKKFPYQLCIKVLCRKTFGIYGSYIKPYYANSMKQTIGHVLITATEENVAIYVHIMLLVKIKAQASKIRM